MLSITVDTLMDELDGSIVDGDISLRDAIAVAPSAETIDFAAGLDGGIILMSLGQLAITDALTIDATSLASGLTIDAQQNSRIFNIDDPSTTSENFDVTLAGLTLTRGRTTGDSADFLDDTNNGGAIRSLTSGNLTID
ncbi:unnamed protein product, partial [marine sediment metagenome]